MRRSIVAICLALAGLSLATGSTAAAAQGRNASRPVTPVTPATPAITTPADPATEQPAEVRGDDAHQYATLFNVSEDEAERRLTAQVETGAATDALVREFGARLAGISVAHRPDYRITVLLTGDAPVADRVLTTSTMRVPVHFQTGAPATRQRILAAIETHQADIRRMLSYPPGMGVDARTGSLLVTVDAVDLQRNSAERLTDRFERMTGVPVRIRSLGGSENTGIEGGSRVEGVSPSDGRRYACTTGFVVTDGSRTGIVTAAHCPDTMSHVDAQRRETPLEFVGQWGWGYQDVQLHVSASPMSGTFYADTARTRLRAVSGQLSRSETRSGDYVCHRGERTGYSCAEVEMTDFAPPGDLCGGPCLPTWVTVRGPDCQGGDSGAPVFSGTTAYGIVKGASYRSDGRCIFYFYMSTDYLPQGWSLVHGGPGAPPPAQVARAGATGTAQQASIRR